MIARLFSLLLAAVCSVGCNHPEQASLADVTRSRIEQNDFIRIQTVCSDEGCFFQYNSEEGKIRLRLQTCEIEFVFLCLNYDGLVHLAVPEGYRERWEFDGSSFSRMELSDSSLDAQITEFRNGEVVANYIVTNEAVFMWTNSARICLPRSESSNLCVQRSHASSLLIKFEF